MRSGFKSDHSGRIMTQHNCFSNFLSKLWHTMFYIIFLARCSPAGFGPIIFTLVSSVSLSVLLYLCLFFSESTHWNVLFCVWTLFKISKIGHTLQFENLKLLKWMPKVFGVEKGDPFTFLWKLTKYQLCVPTVTFPRKIGILTILLKKIKETKI